jgi:hypothetical protein
MLTVPTVSDDFSRADSSDMGGSWVELPGPGRWTYTSDLHHQIRETCETIQQVAITIAVPVFAGLGALLLAGLVRAVWMF